MLRTALKKTLNRNVTILKSMKKTHRTDVFSKLTKRNLIVKTGLYT